MNIKDDFIKWFEPKAPQSYKTWFGKKINSKFDEMSLMYKTSFETELFDINVDNIQAKIIEINNNINKRFDKDDKTFANYNQKSSNGIPQAIIGKWFIRFIQNYDGTIVSNDDSDEIITNSEIIKDNISFTYEQDLQNSLISQAEDLFPGYQIYGTNGEGIEYTINGKRIDLLMENLKENKLLAIELKAGKADFKVFGQISMYLQLLEETFNGKNISGVIIASEIDETLKITSRRDEQLNLMTYRMELKLNEIQKL
jgi:hypothetical protein